MPETSSLEEPSVISLNWYRGLPTGAAVGLLDRARAADAEMDFSAPTGNPRRHPRTTSPPKFARSCIVGMRPYRANPSWQQY